MIIDTCSKIPKAIMNPNTDKKVQNHAMYITNFNNVPKEVLDGIIIAFNNARKDHAIGIYSYFFSQIYKLSLARIYYIKIGKKKIRQAGVPYLQRYIINPAYDAIREACKDMPIVSIIHSENINIAHGSFETSEE